MTRESLESLIDKILDKALFHEGEGPNGSQGEFYILDRDKSGNNIPLKTALLKTVEKYVEERENIVCDETTMNVLDSLIELLKQEGRPLDPPQERFVQQTIDAAEAHWEALRQQVKGGVRMTIYCTGCEKEIEARLTDGQERYPHRPDLYELPFWKCDICGGYVGCHHKTATPTKPLGFIATPAILDARKKIHALLDPIWKSGKMKRGQAYAYVGHRLGHPYHNGEIRTVEEAREIYKIVVGLHNNWLRRM